MRPRRLVTVIYGALETALCICVCMYTVVRRLSDAVSIVLYSFLYFVLN